MEARAAARAFVPPPLGPDPLARLDRYCFGADAHVEEELRFVDEVEGEAMAWGAEPLDGCLT